MSMLIWQRSFGGVVMEPSCLYSCWLLVPTPRFDVYIVIVCYVVRLGEKRISCTYCRSINPERSVLTFETGTKRLTKHDDIGYTLAHDDDQCKYIHATACSVHLDRSVSDRKPNHSESGYQCSRHGEVLETHRVIANIERCYMESAPST
jgi:hypothetical protein